MPLLGEAPLVCGVGGVVGKLGVAQLALSLGEALPRGADIAGDEVEIASDCTRAALKVANIDAVARLAETVDIAMEPGDVIAHVVEGLVGAGGIGREARRVIAGAAEVAIMLQVALDACPRLIQPPLGIAQARFCRPNRWLSR